MKVQWKSVPKEDMDTLLANMWAGFYYHYKMHPKLSPEKEAEEFKKMEYSVAHIIIETCDLAEVPEYLGATDFGTVKKILVNIVTNELVSSAMFREEQRFLEKMKDMFKIDISYAENFSPNLKKKFKIDIFLGK